MRHLTATMAAEIIHLSTPVTMGHIYTDEIYVTFSDNIGQQLLLYVSFLAISTCLIGLLA